MNDSIQLLHLLESHNEKHAMKVLMLHGINHNMSGKRDPKQYGTITLQEIDAALRVLARSSALR